MKARDILWILLFLVIIFAGCNKDYPVYPIDRTVPDQRSFYMGFTPFPYDITTSSLDTTYNNILANGDIVLIQLDNGVPWAQALNGKEFPPDLQHLIARVRQLPRDSVKLYLAVTPADISSDSLAPYWSDEGIENNLPWPWNTYSFDSAQVIKAYINYCKRLIDTLHPDYFAYAIRINAVFKNNTPAFNSFMKLADTVYSRLKADYPDLPVFMTFQDQAINKTKAELLTVTRFLLKYSDWVAVSTFPFWQYQYPNRDANPQYFPNTWLEELHNLAPYKPFAVAETGYIAEDLSLPSYGVDIKATDQWQADYLQKVLIEAHKLDARFVIWYIFRDYDFLYERMDNPPEYMKIWKDTGLENGLGFKRPSYYVWKQWQVLKINQL